MANEYLPLKVDPFRFADNATRMHGSLPIKNMERLAPSLASDQGDIEINIQFGVDEQKLRYLHGHLSTQLILQCQRCMESFNYEIISDFKLGIVKTEEEAKELPDRYDPLLADGIEVLIQDVIEDELIVSLPIVPMHSAENCRVGLPLKAESGERVEKENPFKVIELLRVKSEKDK
jgi:uncharacterized protein